jgi:hypothetical protein
MRQRFNQCQGWLFHLPSHFDLQAQREEWIFGFLEVAFADCGFYAIPRALCSLCVSVQRPIRKSASGSQH